jgi:hypothetical protein
MNQFIEKRFDFNCFLFLKSLYVFDSYYPFAHQFWFIRDLIILILFTPIIYLLFKYLRVFLLIFLGMLWYSHIWYGFTGMSVDALFFFSAGAWLGMNRCNLIELFGKIRLLSFIVYPLIVTCEMLTVDVEYSWFIHNTGIIVGIPFWFNLAATLINKGLAHTNRFLVSASFFVFAMHDPFMIRILRKTLYSLFNADSFMVLTVIYFMVAILTVTISLLIYYPLSRFFPRFTSFITGGR